MLADSLCDSPWANRSHRGWTTLVSFALQAIALGSLLLLPLLYTSGLPRPQWMAVLVAPARTSDALPRATRAQPANSAVSNLSSEGRMIAPPSIPQTIEPVTETTAPPTVDLGDLGVSGGTGDRRARNGAWNSIGNGLNVVVAPPPVVHPPRVSRVMEGNLIRRVQPEYPAAARSARVQGAVVLHAVISKQGTIENLQVISGSPLLVRAALAAVSQWRYRPYYLNDEPVEVDTQVTVNFVLSGG
jgi:protein TonB